MIYLKLLLQEVMNKYRKAYILGIGGTGMSSIAKYLSQSGLSVGGYDQRRSYITNTLEQDEICLLYTSPSPRDATLSRMPSSA